jgi:hypothetical protein
VLGQGGARHDSLAVKSVPAQESSPGAPAAGAGAADSAGGATLDTQAAPAPNAAPAPAARKSAPAPSASAPQAFSAPPPLTKSSAPRKVQRSATLSLQAPFAKVGATSDAVIRTVDRFGGIVASSSINDAAKGGEASFDLRIPTARLDDALAALSKLGHVADRTQDLQDITSSFTSAQDRLADARAERRGLLRALGRATTRAQIDSLRARLRESRGRIARLEGELRSLRRRADLSVVALTITGVADGAGAATGGNWSPGDAAGDALRVLEVMAGVTLIALAIAVPLGLLGVAIVLAARGARRRGRERALDPA